jgi:hypothetical protein
MDEIRSDLGILDEWGQQCWSSPDSETMSEAGRANPPQGQECNVSNAA